MKLIFASEDCLVGILFGALVISLSEKWFKIANTQTYLMIVIPLFVIFIFLDIIHEVSDLGRHFMFVGGSILQNLFDLVLCIAFYAVFFNFSLPVIGSYLPYLADKAILYWIGIFEVVSHIIWLALTPFNN